MILFLNTLSERFYQRSLMLNGRPMITRPARNNVRRYRDDNEDWPFHKRRRRNDNHAFAENTGRASPWLRLVLLPAGHK